MDIPKPIVKARTGDRTFILREPENEKTIQFMSEHRAKHGRYEGAIGGRFTFSFTPTSIGTVQEVLCGSCDDKLDVTDYDMW